MPPRRRRPESFAMVVERLAARRPEVAVLHVYGVEPRGVTGSERDEVAGRIEESFSSGAPPMSDFVVAEFRDELRRVMIIVQESC